MPAKLQFSKIGIRGSTKSWTPDSGQVLLFMDGNGYDYIGADAFDGEGNTYKRRDECQILIKFGENKWEGTKKQLEEIIFKPEHLRQYSERFKRMADGDYSGATEFEEYFVTAWAVADGGTKKALEAAMPEIFFE